MASLISMPYTHCNEAYLEIQWGLSKKDTVLGSYLSITASLPGPK